MAKKLFICWIMFALSSLCYLPSLAVDGEYRLFFAGNFASGTQLQRVQLGNILPSLQAQSTADGIPSFLLLPGNICSPEKAASPADNAALSLAASLSPSAIALGTNELRNGADYLKSLLTSPLPWVTVNEAPKGIPVAITRSITVDSLRIGIVALVLSPGQYPDKPLRDVLAQQIKTLRSKSDVVILLGSFDDIQASVLSALYTSVDMILGCVGITEFEAPSNALFVPVDGVVPYYGQVDFAMRDSHLTAWRGWLKTVDPEEKTEK